MGFFSSLGKVAAGALDVISAPLSQPVATIKGVVTGDIGAGARAVKQTRQNIAAGKQSGVPVIATTIGTTALAAGGILALGGVTGGVAAGSTAAKVGSVLTSKTALGLSTIAALAPKTASKVISNPELATTVAAGAVNPVAGVVVGLEQGTGLVKEAVKTSVESFKEGDIVGGLKAAAPVAAAAAVVAGAGYAASKVIASKISNKAPSTEPVMSTPAVITPTSAPVVSSGTSQTASKTPPFSIKNTIKPIINIAIAR